MLDLCCSKILKAFLVSSDLWSQMDWLGTECIAWMFGMFSTLDVENIDPIMLQGLVTHFGETSRVKETQRLHGTHLETKTLKGQHDMLYSSVLSI